LLGEQRFSKGKITATSNIIRTDHAMIALLPAY